MSFKFKPQEGARVFSPQMTRSNIFFKIQNQWEKWTQKDESFPMICISFHIFDFFYKGTSRSKQVQLPGQEMKKDQDWKWTLPVETSNDQLVRKASFIQFITLFTTDLRHVTRDSAEFL